MSSDDKTSLLANSKVHGRLRNLSYREKMILMLRLGLFTEDPPRSAVEVGAIFKVASARIRQIELGALEKLRKYLEAT